MAKEKPKKNLNAEQRSVHVARSQGRTPTFLLQFDATEKAAVAALCDAEGKLVPDVAKKWGAIVAGYSDRLVGLKAVDGELDADATNQTRVEQLAKHVKACRLSPAQANAAMKHWGIEAVFVRGVKTKVNFEIPSTWEGNWLPEDEKKYADAATDHPTED